MGVSERRAGDGAVARLAASVASYALGASTESVLELTRGTANEALARQVAMYLCHVAFELSLARVATAFGRDRSTVAYACHAVEDRREEAAFDRWIAELEATLREAPPAGRGHEFLEAAP